MLRTLRSAGLLVVGSGVVGCGGAVAGPRAGADVIAVEPPTPAAAPLPPRIAHPVELPDRAPGTAASVASEALFDVRLACRDGGTAASDACRFHARVVEGRCQAASIDAGTCAARADCLERRAIVLEHRDEVCAPASTDPICLRLGLTLRTTYVIERCEGLDPGEEEARGASGPGRGGSVTNE